MKEEERSYELTNADLLAKCSAVAQFMARDEAEFTARNVSVADRTAFEAATTAFGDMDPDSYYLSIYSEKVDDRNALRENMTKLIQKISGYFQQEWGLSSTQYQGLGIKNLQKKSDAEFLIAAKQVKRRADDRLGVLGTLGLTQADIDALAADNLAFDDAMDAVAVADELRKKKTEDRILAGNALYDLLSKYCEIGKLIWENVSPANYEDYVIYKTVHSGLSKVQGFAAVQNGPNAFDLTWDPVVGADNYEVDFAQATTGQPQGPWQPHSSPLTPNDTFPVSPGFSYWLRVRARNNAGLTGGWSDVVIVEGT